MSKVFSALWEKYFARVEIFSIVRARFSIEAARFTLYSAYYCHTVLNRWARACAGAEAAVTMRVHATAHAEGWGRATLAGVPRPLSPLPLQQKPIHKTADGNPGMRLRGPQLVQGIHIAGRARAVPDQRCAQTQPSSLRGCDQINRFVVAISQPAQRSSDTPCK